MKSPYIAKQPDQNGYIHYDDVENNTWKTLYHRQIEVIQDRACGAFIDGLAQLNMSSDRIPQLGEVNDLMQSFTGWSVEQVPAIISPNAFFDLLANKKFPAATFIRRVEELDYLEEPDIFHELFGHCPLLVHEPFANFVEAYGQFALSAKKSHRRYLARLFWFTVEFGLINTSNGLRCFGGGILSSKGETIAALESLAPERKPFDLQTVLRTPYRVDQMQGVYFIIDDFEQLFNVLEKDLNQVIEHARTLSEFELIEIEKGADKDEWTTC